MDKFITKINSNGHVVIGHKLRSILFDEKQKYNPKYTGMLSIRFRTTLLTWCTNLIATGLFGEEERKDKAI